MMLKTSVSGARDRPISSTFARLLIIVFGCSLVLFTAISEACKLPADYQGPSNFELVQLADSIVIARANSFVLNKDDAFVRFNVIEKIKGATDLKQLSLEGWDKFEGAGNDTDFSQPRPGAFSGSCIPFDYRKGALYLLFLRSEGKNVELLDFPFTRVNEEITPDSNWLMAVRKYVQISEVKDKQRRDEELSGLLQWSESNGSSYPFAAPIASDLRRHFATPSWYKSAPELLQIFNSGTDESIKLRTAGSLFRLICSQTGTPPMDLLERLSKQQALSLSEAKAELCVNKQSD